MDDLSRFRCQNHPCPDYGKRDAKKLTVTAHYGPDNPRQMLGCRTCKVRFSERQGTVLFHAKRTAQTVGAILEHLSEPWGSGPPAASVASIEPRWAAPGPSQATRPGPSTRTSWLFPPRTREVQCDEKGSFVSQKQKPCDPLAPADDRRGDCWDQVALAPEHRLVVRVVGGQRTAETTREVVEQFHRHSGGRPMEADGLDHHRRGRRLWGGDPPDLRSNGDAPTHRPTGPPPQAE